MELRINHLFGEGGALTLYKPFVAVTTLALAILSCNANALPVTAPVIGEIQRITVNSADHWSGGTMTIGGIEVIIPRNLLIDLPANRLTLQELFEQAPSTCVAARETGLAKGDSCNATGAGGIANIAATRSSAGNVIAGDVFIQKGAETITGVVTYIDYNDGYFRLNGDPANPVSTGVMVRINDPDSRHTVQRGLGCSGVSNCSADPRFTLDGDNYTNVFSSGYPLCIPSTVTRSFVDQLSLGTTVSVANADGTGDVLCPQSNRASDPVNDSRRFAPIMLGDSITAEGNFERVGGTSFLSAHSTMVGRALSTRDVPGQPDYMFLDEVAIDAPGFQNQRIRTLYIGFTTLPSDVLIWSLHYDPVTNAPHEFPLATVRGCDIAAGAGTCGRQGLVAGAGGNIFKIRHDVDFLTGAKARLDPCAHLRADPRMGANICPTGQSTGTNIAEMMGILSPIPHEIQARTGHLLASQAAGGTPLITIDINGNTATNGQYLFPFGLGLGGISVPEFVEIDLNALGTPVSFSGIPWNLDRRLSPGGCIDTTGDGIVDCEATVQPLEPFPFEGTDPRLLTANLPFGQYNDPNFTSAPLVTVRDRILSYVRTGGTFNGNATVLAWPPLTPAARAINVTSDVALSCVADATTPSNPPVAVNDSASTVAGAFVDINVLANDSGNALSIVNASVTVGAGTLVTNVAKTILRFTPASGFTGLVVISYTITDGVLVSAPASVNVTVLPPPPPVVNVAPVANPDAASTRVGVPVTINVLANDTDVNVADTLSVTGVTLGTAQGTVVTTNTTVTFTPSLTAAGTTQTFSYTISDGHPGGTATGTVSVTVAAADTVAVTAAQFRTGKGELRVTGTGSVVGAQITVFSGSTLTGPVLGTAVVDVTGAWTLRVAGITVLSTTISIQSTSGARILGIPLAVRN